ncbi:GNAT family N-acetyltransferase [Geomonas sp. RF6]|uniref:GNAT family N-acetyltransferase n=1 Tax=Geomonas sp. RF6 TaxID=2897342 RepID=UPI001E2C5039|nr:GNAT family N-acetyltransferase [Geomonas sp. RF6]UFS70281.1 GNAT family N-acetyltransferase [Geomonas sp. RF6]
MGAEAFTAADIPSFLTLAEREGWICEAWELEFLLATFGQGCRVWRENGGAGGFVTSIGYGKSGWIGNLLVVPEMRRKGIGRTLMQAAVLALLHAGVETVWLTASQQGAELYRRLGFMQVDTVQRWVGEGKGNAAPPAAPLDLEWLRAIDRAGWGDRRDRLLQLASSRGALLSTSGAFLCKQRWGSGVQIGPWGCVIPAQAPSLLDAALGAAQGRVFLDVPAGNHAAAQLLSSRGFSVKGQTALMYLGAPPPYQPGNIFALGSMGSMG